MPASHKTLNQELSMQPLSMFRLSEKNVQQWGEQPCLYLMKDSRCSFCHTDIIYRLWAHFPLHILYHSLVNKLLLMELSHYLSRCTGETHEYALGLKINSSSLAKDQIMPQSINRKMLYPAMDSQKQNTNLFLYTGISTSLRNEKNSFCKLLFKCHTKKFQILTWIT